MANALELAAQQKAFRLPLFALATSSSLRGRSIIGLGIVGVWVMVAIAWPVLAPYQPTALHPDSTLSPPSTHFLFGTDQLGRDVFSRVLAGSRDVLIEEIEFRQTPLFRAGHLLRGACDNGPLAALAEEAQVETPGRHRVN